MTVIVTGAAGVVGSRLVRALNEQGVHDVVAVDCLRHDEGRFANLAAADIVHYVDKGAFIRQVCEHRLDGKDIDVLFHLGEETAGNAADLMEGNYQYTRDLLEWCRHERIRMIYASSAAVYGTADGVGERADNPYAYSKLLFDRVLRQKMDKGLRIQVAGLRPFEVYGTGAGGAGGRDSFVFGLFEQYRRHGRIRLDGDWGQQRDFVAADDVVRAYLFCYGQPDCSGIFDCGSGRLTDVADVAAWIVDTCRERAGEPEWSKETLFAEGVLLREADGLPHSGGARAADGALRTAGFGSAPTEAEAGIRTYVRDLLAQSEI